ncbi:TonB-dependent siderophore receptor [Longibacter sp.]|uniref:TonB-dependent siderophore receptor n=1 Tax=Longibacter sp. TaxID=2045415 RepID=UPI003EBC8583
MTLPDDPPARSTSERQTPTSRRPSALLQRVHRALPVRLVIWVLLCLLSTPAAAQEAATGRVVGTIAEATTGETVEGVNVGLRGTTLGAATGVDGKYAIEEVPAGTYVIQASFIGYETVQREITVEEGQTTTANFRFTQDDVELQGVEVIGRRARGYEADYSFVATKSATPLENVPQSISVITKEVLDDQQVYRLDEALRNVSGVNTFSGYNDYTARGFRTSGGSSSDARLINGLKGGFSFWTSPILPHIERVEIIKGPASALFANTNPGGTINLVTKKPLRTSRQSLNFTLGSYDTYRSTADFTGPLNDDGTVLYRLNLGYENAESFRTLQFNESYLIAPSVSFIPNERTRVNVDLVYSDLDSRLDRGQPIFNQSDDLTSTPISFALSQPGDYMHNTNFHVTASLSHEFTDWLELNSSYMKFRYDQDLEEHRTSNVFLPNDPTILQLAFIKRDQERTVDNVTNYLTAEFKTGPVSHEALGGVDFFQQDDNRTQWGARGADQFILPDGTPTPGGNVGNFDLEDPVYTIEGRNSSTYEANWFSQARTSDPIRSRTYGAYIQDQLSYGPVRLLLSLRHEWYRDILPEEQLEGLRSAFPDVDNTAAQSTWLPRIGGVVEVANGINIYSTYAEGFEPQTAESVLNPQLGGPFDPQESNVVEGGAKARLLNGQLLATAAIYQITKQNVLVNANDAANPQRLEQRGEERARGVELEVAGEPIPGLRLTTNYAYNRAEITESDDENEIGRIKENAPEHAGGFWGTYTVQSGALTGLGFGGGMQFVTERNTFEETLQLPGYAIWDATVFYTVNSFKIKATMKNLTDETYWTGGYNYGRIYPGAPRTALLSVGYTF